MRTGRFQEEDQALEIDRGLRTMMDREGMPYTTLAPDLAVIHAFAATLL
jgi:hypothetical protein